MVEVQSIGGPFHENQVSFLIGFLRGVISMVGGWGGSLNWFSWIAKSRGGFHGLSDLRLIVMGESTGTISGEATPKTRAQKKRERTAEQPRKP